MDMAPFLSAVLMQSTPILLAALATMITLRANILNVAAEGMMLVAAFVAIAVGGMTGRAFVALIAAVAASIIVSMVLALFTLRLHADFIVAGLGINLLAAGGTVFLLERVYNNPGGLRPITFPEIWHVPEGSLSFLPVIGPALEGQSIIVLLGLLAIPACLVFLYWTPTGSYLRAAGEDEHAARSAGIRVGRMKTLAVGISGLLSGLAGAQLAMDRLQFFLPDMTAGRGFIGARGHALRWRSTLDDRRRSLHVRLVQRHRGSPAGFRHSRPIRADAPVHGRRRRTHARTLAHAREELPRETRGHDQQCAAE